MTQEQLSGKVANTLARLLKLSLSMEDLPEDELWALLAWELWKDGRDWDEDLENIASGRGDIQFHHRSDAISYLKAVFGY
jgi:hypothetical protein